MTQPFRTSGCGNATGQRLLVKVNPKFSRKRFAQPIPARKSIDAVPDDVLLVSDVTFTGIAHPAAAPKTG